MRGQGWRYFNAVTAEMAAQESGFLLQPRVTAHPGLSRRFGPALWSVRLLTLLTSDGPVVHRTVAAIATGANPAGNLWRPGNALGAVDRDTGVVRRVVRGTGTDTNMVVDEACPEYGSAHYRHHSSQSGPKPCSWRGWQCRCCRTSAPSPGTWR